MKTTKTRAVGLTALAVIVIASGATAISMGQDIFQDYNQRIQATTKKQAELTKQVNEYKALLDSTEKKLNTETANHAKIQSTLSEYSKKIESLENSLK